jgi:hypothetical protein
VTRPLRSDQRHHRRAVLRTRQRSSNQSTLQQRYKQSQLHSLCVLSCCASMNVAAAASAVRQNATANIAHAIKRSRPRHRS